MLSNGKKYKKILRYLTILIMSFLFFVPISINVLKTSPIYSQQNSIIFNYDHQLKSGNSEVHVKSDDPNSVNFKYSSVGGINTVGSLAPLGVIKNITMDKIHVSKWWSMFSQIKFIDVNNNVVPWTINWDQNGSLWPKFSNGYKTYDKNLGVSTSGPLVTPDDGKNANIWRDDIKFRLRKMIENSLQDNKFSPYIDNQYLIDGPHTLFSEFRNAVKSWFNYKQDKLDYNDYAAIGFEHRWPDFWGGIDFSFKLDHPAILDRIEISMSISDTNNLNSYLGEAGIENLTLETISGDFFSTQVHDVEAINSWYKKWPNDYHIKYYHNMTKPWAKPFSRQNPMNKKLPDSISYDIYNKNKPREPRGVEVLSSDIRFIPVIGGKYDKNLRKWTKISSVNTDNIASDLLNTVTFGDGVFRDLISIDAPEGYTALIVNERKDGNRKKILFNENNQNLSLARIPALENVDNNYINYGHIYAKPGDKLHIFYIKTGYSVQNLSLMDDWVTLSQFKNNYGNDSFVIPNNNIIEIKGKNVPDYQTIHYNWLTRNIKTNFIKNFKNGTRINTVIDWQKLNIPKDKDGDYIFDVILKHRSHHIERSHGYNYWTLPRVIDVKNEPVTKIIRNINADGTLPSQMEIWLVTKNKYSVNNLDSKQVFHFIEKVTEKENFLLNPPSFGSLFSPYKNMIETENNLIKLGNIKAIEFDMMIPAGSSITDLRINDVANNRINYTLQNYKVINSLNGYFSETNNSNEISNKEPLLEMANLWNDDDGSLMKILGNYNKFVNNGKVINSSGEEVPFGYYKDDKRVKFKILLSNWTSLNNFIFQMGLEGHNNLSFNKITVDLEDDSSLVWAPDGFEKIYNTFYNTSGKRFSDIDDNSKVNIFGPKVVLSAKRMGVFGSEKLQWLSKQNKVSEKISNVGNIKEGLISIYGNLDEENRGKNIEKQIQSFYNLLFMDENGDPIEYEIVNTYFMPGMDGDSFGIYNDGKSEFHSSDKKYKNMYSLDQMAKNLQDSSKQDVSYPNKYIKVVDKNYQSIYGHVPIASIHFRFKDKLPHKIKSIKTITKGYNKISNNSKKVPRRIDVKLYDDSGKIFIAKSVSGTDKYGTLISDDIASSDIITSYFGISNVEWEQLSTNWGNQIGIDFGIQPEAFKYNYEVYDASKKRWVKLNKYKIINNETIQIRISKRSNAAYARYGIIGFNPKGDSPIEDVKKRLAELIKMRVNEDIILNKYYSASDRNNPDISLLYKFFVFQNYDPMEISNAELVNWINSIESPQLLTHTNIVNFANEMGIKLEDKDINLGTGALGDGSDNFYEKYLLPFIDGSIYKIINYNPAGFKEREITLENKPLEDMSNVKLDGVNLYGTLDYSQFLEYYNYQNIEIVVNPRHNPVSYVNSIAINIKNGDYIKVIIKPKNGIKTYYMSNNQKILFDKPIEKTIQINNLPPSKIISGFRSEMEKVTFEGTGKEGAISIPSVARLLNKVTSYENIDYFISFKSNGEEIKVLKNPVLIDLLIFYGYEVEIEFKPKNGYVFEDEKNIFSSHKVNVDLSKMEMIDKKDNPTTPEKIFFYINKENKIKAVSDSLAFYKSTSYEMRNYNLEISVNPQGTNLISYKTNDINDFIDNALLFEGDTIIFKLFLKDDQYFKNNQKYFSTEYKVPEFSNDKSDNSKELNYTDQELPDTLIYGGTMSNPNVKISQNNIDYLVKSGYKLTFFVFRPSEMNGAKELDFLENIKSSDYLKNDLNKIYKIKENSNRSYIKEIVIDDMFNIPNKILSNEIMEDDIILLFASPNTKYDYKWSEDSDYFGEILTPNIGITKKYDVEDLPILATTYLPRINGNFVGYNNKTEIRQKEIENGKTINKFNKGLLIPDLQDYLNKNQNIDVEAYIVSDYTNSYVRGFLDKKLNDNDYEEVNNPVIIQGLESLGEYSNSHKSGKVKNLLEAFPSVKNGDYILVRFSAKNGLVFPNGSSVISTSFYVRNLPYAIPKPKYPKKEDKNFYNGIDGNGYLYQDAFDIQNKYYDVIVTYDSNGVVKKFNSMNEAIKNLNNLSNNDKIRIQVIKRDNNWWGLEVKDVDHKDFQVDVTYTISNLLKQVTEIDTPIASELKLEYFSGSSGQVMYDLNEYINNSGVDIDKTIIKLIYTNYSGVPTSYNLERGKFASDNPQPFFNGGSVKVSFTPKKGFTFNKKDANGNIIRVVESPPLKINKFPESVLSKIFPGIDESEYNELNIVHFKGFNGAAVPSVMEIDSEFGHFELALKKPDGSYEKYPNNYDAFNDGDEVFVILYPNHANNYWINNDLNKDNPENDFLAIPQKVSLNYEKLNNISIQESFNNLFKSASSPIKISGNKYKFNVQLDPKILEWAKQNNIELMMNFYDIYSGRKIIFKIKNSNYSISKAHLDLSSISFSYIGKKGYIFQAYPNADRYTSNYYILSNETKTHKLECELSFDNFSEILLVTPPDANNYNYLKDNWKTSIDNFEVSLPISFNSTMSAQEFFDLFDIELFRENGAQLDKVDSNLVSFEFNYDKTYNDRPFNMIGYIFKIIIDKKMAISKNDYFKLVIKVKKEKLKNNQIMIDSKYNFNSIDEFYIDDINFEYAKNIIDTPKQIDKIIFLEDYDISGNSILDLEAMGLANNDNYNIVYQIINGQTGEIKTFQNITQDNYTLPDLSIGDSISIKVVIKNIVYDAFVDYLNNRPVTQSVVLKNKKITYDDLKSLTIIEKVTNETLELSGGNGEGKISLSKIKTVEVNIEIQVRRDGKVIPYETETLKNGDILLIKFSQEFDNATIIYDGVKHTAPFVVEHKVQGLSEILKTPNLVKENFKIIYKNNDDLGVIPDWQKIFGENSELENLLISVSLESNGVKIWELLENNSNWLDVAKLINEKLIENHNMKYNSTFKISLKTKPGYTFTSFFGKEINLEILLDDPSPNYVKVRMPKNITFKNLKDVSGSARLELSIFELNYLKDNNINYEFILNKKSGEEHIFTNNSDLLLQKIDNGDKITFRIWVEKNKDGKYNEVIIFNGAINHELSRSYSVSGLYERVILPQDVNDLFIINGFNNMANLQKVKNQNTNDVSFAFSVEKNDGTISSRSFSFPKDLENGDNITIYVIPHQNYAILDSDTEDRLEQDYQYKMSVKNLLDLLNVKLPDNIAIKYNDDTGNYSIPQLDKLLEEYNIKIRYNNKDKLSSEDIAINKKINISIDSIYPNDVLNENSEKSISKEYIIPPIIKFFNTKFTNEEVFYRNNDGDIGIRREPFISDYFNFEFRIFSKTNSNEEEWSLSPPLKINDGEKLIIKVMPKNGSNVVFIDENTQMIQEMTPELLKIEKVTVPLPENLYFEGINGKGTIITTEELKLIFDSGLRYYFKIKDRQGNEKNVYKIPNNLSNGDSVKLILENSNDVFNEVGSKIMTDYKIVRNLPSGFIDKNISYIVFGVLALITTGSAVSLYIWRRRVVNNARG